MYRMAPRLRVGKAVDVAQATLLEVDLAVFHRALRILHRRYDALELHDPGVRIRQLGEEFEATSVQVGFAARKLVDRLRQVRLVET